MLDFGALWRRAVLAELSWSAPDGPRGMPVVPLMLDELPCVALPYMHLDAIDTMTGVTAALSVTDGTMLAEDATAAVAVGDVEIIHDLQGATFVEELLEQEVVKYPPSRLLADGLMARRENWWWVPRVLVSMTGVQASYPVPARTAAQDAVLVRDHPGQPRLDVVTAAQWQAADGGTVDVWPKDGSLLEGEGESAYAFGHRHSPDFERWEPWYRRGVLSGEAMTVTDADGFPGFELEPFGIWRRLRHHRATERACRSGIATAEARP